VEITLEDLAHSGCLHIESNDVNVKSSNFGRIAFFYYSKYTTVEIYKASLHPKTKQKGLLEILCASTEFEKLITRPDEKSTINKILSTIPSLIHLQTLHEYQRKCLALLVTHFSRLHIKTELSYDLTNILFLMPKLTCALVDVCASLGFVKPLLYAMEMSQMVIQGQWSHDSPLIQIPYITREYADKIKQKIDLDTIYNLMDISSKKRKELFSHLSKTEMTESIKFCNKYPDIRMNASILNKPNSGKQLTLEVKLMRGIKQENILSSKTTIRETPRTISHLSAFHLYDSFSTVEAPLFPNKIQEGWWILGIDNAENLLFIKKVLMIPNKPDVYNYSINFIPSLPEPGKYSMTIHLMSDSYCGCDQAIDIEYVE